MKYKDVIEAEKKVLELREKMYAYVVDLYKKGWTYFDISIEVGLSYTTIQSYINKQIKNGGLSKTYGKSLPENSTHLSTDQVIELLDLYLKGVSIYRIARHFTLSKCSIMKIIEGNYYTENQLINEKRLTITLRKKPGRPKKI